MYDEKGATGQSCCAAPYVIVNSTADVCVYAPAVAVTRTV